MKHEHSSNPKLTNTAKTLRKNMTSEERRLWYDFLKKLPISVHRQKTIGPYIVDFYINCAALVLELDGSQHYESEKQRETDLRRDFWLREHGLTVVRYDNRDVRKHFESVCADILQRIKQSGASVNLSEWE